MITIPRPLQIEEFRFIKIIVGTKRPKELKWQEKNNYKFNDPKFQAYLTTAKSYGVLAGKGGLIIIDTDEKTAAETLKKKYHDTFIVQSPGSKLYHIYLIVKDFKDKLVLLDKNKKHYGEIQSTGSQVLGPNSLHPNGGIYKIIHNVRIKETTKTDLMVAVKKFIKTPIKEGNRNQEMFKYCSKLVRKNKTLEEIQSLATVENNENYIPALSESELSKIIESAWSYKEHEFTEEELAELKNPKLLFNIIREAQKEGIVGEEKSLIVLINRINMRLLENYSLTSSNLLVSDDTGLGKDNVTEKLCKIMLEQDKTLFAATDVSEHVLNYWESPSGSWNNKVLYLQDPSKDVLKCQAFKLRASGENAIVTLDTERNVKRTLIKGKPVILVTSMKANIDIELIRRWDAVRLDPSAELTKAITEYQVKKAVGEINDTSNETLQYALKNLSRVKVKIPYAKELLELIPVRESIMRTQISKIMDIIKANTALYQFQRKQDKDGYILATHEDLAVALFIINSCNILSGQALTRQQERVMTALDIEKALSKTELMEKVAGISSLWLYENESDMVERGLIKTTSVFDAMGGKSERGYIKTPHTKHLMRIPENLNGYASKELIKDINNERKKHNLPPIKLL